MINVFLCYDYSAKSISSSKSMAAQRLHTKRSLQYLLCHIGLPLFIISPQLSHSIWLSFEKRLLSLSHGSLRYSRRIYLLPFLLHGFKLSLRIFDLKSFPIKTIRIVPFWYYNRAISVKQPWKLNAIKKYRGIFPLVLYFSTILVLCQYLFQILLKFMVFVIYCNHSTI